MNFSRLKESVKAHEGFRDRVYQDTLGFDTIGYGFAIKDLRLDSDLSGILLDRKLYQLVIDVYTRLPWVVAMPGKIEEVIVEMCYQLGIGGFSKFKKTIAFLKDGDFENAGKEMLDSRWAKQTPNRARGMSEIVKGI